MFSWDQPGSGDSTGEFDQEHGRTQSATILTDGVRILAEHPAIASQGSEAHQAALERARNTMFHVEVIPGAGHTLTPSKADGCVTGGGDYAPRYLELIDEWASLLHTP